MNDDRVLWRRLDPPGHDGCRLIRRHPGWLLEGTAAFLHGSGPACLGYRVACDHQWRTEAATVRGWVGGLTLDLRIVRTASGLWLVNEQAVPGLNHCLDLDLGFTPATNLPPLRRLALRIGQAVDVPAAWLDIPGCALEELMQRYERRDPESYWYAAPRFNYAALLKVRPSGWIETYPGLWQAEPTPTQPGPRQQGDCSSE